MIRITRLILFFLIMFLSQVLIFNHIFLFGAAIPLVFIYFIIRQPIGMNVNLLLTLSFLLGLAVDICCDTPGVNALACTVLAMMRKHVFFWYVLRDDHSGMVTPTITSIGFTAYLGYLLTLTGIFSIMAFAIEYFSIENVKEIVVKGVSSALLTSVLLLSIDSLTSSKRE